MNGGSGVTYGMNPPIEGDTGWYDSGTTLKVSTDSTYNSDGSTRQRIASLSIDDGPKVPTGATTIVATSEIVMYAAHSVNFYSVTQYHVLFVTKDNSGSTTLTPDSIQLTVNGGNRTAAGSAVWSDSGATVSVAGVFWHGLNVAPAQPTQYTVLSPLTITVNARVFDATIVVTDAFGLPVGGANAEISLANGTVMHTSTNGDGTISLRMIPLGTCQGTVGNLGFSSAFSADASVNKTAEVRISLSYPVIIAAVAIITVIVIGILIIIRRRR